DRAEAAAGPLRLVEELDVDLRGEDLVQAAHEAAPGERVVVVVERGTLRGDARRRPDHAIAELRAATALGDVRAADDPRHRRTIPPPVGTAATLREVRRTAVSAGSAADMGRLFARDRRRRFGAGHRGRQAR